MRENGFSPEPDVNETSLSPANRGGEFMVGWLRRLKKFPETEKDDEKEEKPKSRFSRFFGKLFGHMASKEDVRTGQGNRPHVPLYELFMSPTEKVQDPELPKPTEPLEKEVSWSPTESTEYDTPEESISRKREAPIQELDINQPTTEPIEQIALRNTEYSEPRSREQTVFERRSEPEPVKREQVIERRVAEPLAVLEYFLRRRAVKNVERQVRKETATLEKRLRQSTEATERLEQLQQKSQEQIRQLREKRDAPERRPGVAAPRSEKIERPLPIPEKRQPVPETLVRPLEVKAEVKEPERPVRPDIVLEKVVEAAEKNAPIEKLYERRAEVKDEPSKFSSHVASGPVPISTVLSQTVQQSVLDGKARKQLAKAVRNAHQSNEDGMYKKAAVSGFWAALIILVTLTVVLFT